MSVINLGRCNFHGDKWTSRTLMILSHFSFSKSLLSKLSIALLKGSKCVISSQESFFSFPQCQAAANVRQPSISCWLQQKSFYFEEDNTGMSTSLSTFLNVANLSYCCSAKMKEALGPEKIGSSLFSSAWVQNIQRSWLKQLT